MGPEPSLTRKFYLCKSIFCFGILPLIGSAVPIRSWVGGAALFLPRPAPLEVVTSLSLLGVAAGFLGGLPRRGLLGGACAGDTALGATALFSVPPVCGPARFLPLA